MKISFCRRAFDKLSPDAFSRLTARILVVLALLIFVSTVAAIPTEPGSEADGVYTCSQTGRWDFQDGALYLRKLPEPVELSQLELKGKTYYDFKKRGNYNPSFHPFTSDGKSHMKWSNGFTFLASESSIGESVYHTYKGKSFIIIDYSDAKRHKVQMTCTKNE